MRDSGATLEGVADQMPSGVNSLRDRCRGRKPEYSWFRWSRAPRATTGYRTWRHPASKTSR